MCLTSLFFYRIGVDSKGAGVNDSPVDCQSRAPADSQGGESTFPHPKNLSETYRSPDAACTSIRVMLIAPVNPSKENGGS